jgi:putative peptidoglycan lipid II flippase
MKLNLALGTLAGANLVLSLIIQWYVVTRLGVGAATDALFAGMAVPQLVLAVVSGSLMHVLVPLLSGEGAGAFGETAWGFFLGITLLFAVIAGVLYLAAPLWVAWLLPGFSPSLRALTALLTRIQLVGMVFTASLSVLWSAYHARNRFIWAELAPAVSSVLVLAALVPALPRFGVVAAAWANVARNALPVLFLLPGLGRWHAPRWGSPAMKTAWQRLRPLLAGTAYYKTDPLVDRFLSSMASSGSLSILYLGQQIWGAAAQIINKAIAAPMVPLLAVRAKAGSWTAFRTIFRRRLVWMALLTGAGFVAFLAVGEPVLRLLIGHGGVTAENVESLWRIMVGLAGVLIAGSVGQITSTAFYSFGDTRTPTRLGILTYTIYVPAKVLAFFSFGLMGVAVATSLFVLVNVLLQMAFLGPAIRSRAESVL